MNTITQEGPSGCGVACTAQVLGVSYKKTLRLFKDGENKHTFSGFYCKEIVKVLTRRGYESWFEYIKKSKLKSIYKDSTIVFIKRSKKYPQGHYLVRVGKYWMDPWFNMPDITPAKSGFRKRLPGKPIYAIFTKAIT